MLVKLDKNYSTENARQNVHLILRSGGSHEVDEPIPEIGTRIHKQYFTSHPLSDPKVLHLLWWSPYGPDRSMNIQEIHSSLTALQHCQVTDWFNVFVLVRLPVKGWVDLHGI